MDAVYMTATQAMTGQGGWPMTVFMTPEREPFYCGTYFPREQFQRLVLGVANAWQQDRGRRRRAGAPGRLGAGRAAVRPRPRASGRAAAPDAAALSEIAETAVSGLRSIYDAARGGFGGAPKFPPSMVLEFLLRHHERAQGESGGSVALRMAARTLEAMARGGMYDQLGGRVRPVLGGRRLGGAALREDALRQRPAGQGLRALVASDRLRPGPAHRGGDLRLDDRRAGHRRGRVRRRPGRGQRRRGGQVLRLDTRPAPRRARAGRRAVRGRGLRRHRHGHLRARHVGAPAPRRPGGRGALRPDQRGAAAPPGNSGCARPGTTRWSPPGTGWPSRPWPRPACCSSVPSSPRPPGARPS